MRQLINYQLENTDLKCSSSVFFLRSQDFSLERYLVLALVAERNTIEENYAIASSSWYHTGTVKFLDMENHISSYGQEPQNTHTTLERGDSRDSSRNYENASHNGSSPVSLSASGGTYVKTAAGQHNPEIISESFSGLCVAQIRALNYSAAPPLPLALLGELHLNYSNLQEIQQLEGLLLFQAVGLPWFHCPTSWGWVPRDSQREGDESRRHLPCASRRLSEKHVCTCKIYLDCFPIYNPLFLTLSSGEWSLDDQDLRTYPHKKETLPALTAPLLASSPNGTVQAIAPKAESFSFTQTRAVTALGNPVLHLHCTFTHECSAEQM